MVAIRLFKSSQTHYAHQQEFGREAKSRMATEALCKTVSLVYKQPHRLHVTTPKSCTSPAFNDIPQATRHSQFSQVVFPQKKSHSSLGSQILSH